MTRRIIRSLSTIAAFISGVFLVIYLLDTRYRLLPQAIHSALPLHHEGFVVTDVKLKQCSAVNPLTSCKLDPDIWHRIGKDLYLNSGWVKSAFVHVKRKKEEFLEKGEKVVMDIKVSRLDPGSGEKGRKSEWESRPGGIWLLRSANRHDSDSNKAVTGVDVLFGPDAVEPRPGWNLAQTPLLVGTTKDSREPRLSIRHGVPKPLAKTVPPRIRNDGKFKILQVSDLHLSAGVGACRDALDAKGEVKGKCEADPRTLDFVAKVVDEEKPDMAVLSGDQVNGDTAPDVQTALYKAVDLFASRQIPYASIFGNHDDEGQAQSRLSRETQMQILGLMPYNLARAGPSDVDGVGNYYVQILGAAPSKHAALTLYFLDTHSYSPDERTYSGYDWLKPSQIAWFKDTAHKLQPINDKYTRIHLNMAFIHIPLPEFIMTNNTYAGGEVREASTAPKFNTGFHTALREQGVVAVGCGHDHVNDACALRPEEKSGKGKRAAEQDSESAGVSKGSLETAAVEDVSVSSWATKLTLGPWMCYAGGSGFGGYAGHGGYHRRVRVWEIDTNMGRITTWTRVECCGADTKAKHNELTIVDEGKVIAPITDD